MAFEFHHEVLLYEIRSQLRIVALRLEEVREDVRRLHRKRRVVVVSVAFHPKKENPVSNVTVPALAGPDNQDVTISVVPEDSSNVPEPDSLSWAADNTAFTLVPSSDTLSCEVKSPTPVQDVTVNVTASDPTGNSVTIPLTFQHTPGPVTQLVVSAAFHPKPATP